LALVDPEEFNPNQTSQFHDPANHPTGGDLGNLRFSLSYLRMSAMHKLSYQRVELLRILMYFVKHNRANEVTNGYATCPAGPVGIRIRGIVIGFAQKYIGRTDLGADWDREGVELLRGALGISWARLEDAEKSQNKALAEYWGNRWWYFDRVIKEAN